MSKCDVYSKLDFSILALQIDQLSRFSSLPEVEDRPPLGLDDPTVTHLVMGYWQVKPDWGVKHVIVKTQTQIN